MDKTILITRPRGDEERFISSLNENGYRVIHEPLLDIVIRDDETPRIFNAMVDDPDAVIITSRHGIKTLSLLSEIRDPMVICVGEATESVAQSAGFMRTVNTGGNVEKLIEYITASYDEGSKFLYISGEDITVDLPQVLGVAGMDVERIVTYAAEASETLSDTLIEQLRRTQVDAVTFLSKRTAAIFLELLEEADLLECTQNMHAFCMSDAVADILNDCPWAGIHIATDATLASVVNSIDNVFRENG